MKKSIVLCLIFAFGLISCQSDNGSDIKTFYYSTGEIKALIPYSDSLKEGEVIYYHKNGKVKHISYWIKGIQKIEAKEFDENGKELLYQVTFEGTRLANVGKDYKATISLVPSIPFNAYFLCALDYDDSLGYVQTEQAPGNPKHKVDKCMYQIATFDNKGHFAFTPSKKGKKSYDLVLTRVLDDDVLQFYDYQFEIEAE